MARDLGFAVVGLHRGFQAAQEVTQTAGAKLVAVCDIDRPTAMEVAGKLGCEWVTDYHDLLGRDDIDVIGAWTPSGLHGAVCIDALKAGKNAVTTKPMETTPQKCDAMIEVAHKAGKLLAVDFGSRYSPSVRKVRRAMTAGEFGRPMFGSAQMWGYRSQAYYDIRPWRGTWELDGGGSLVNQGVHYVDMLLWMLGDVDRVEYARSAVRGHEIETEDATEAVLTFKNGAWGTIITTTSYVPGVPANIYLAGDRGSVMISEKDIRAWSFKADVVDAKEFGKPPEREVVVPPEEGAPQHWAEDVVSALTKGTKVVCDGIEGRRTVALSAAIFEAARTRKSVKV